MVTLLWLPYVPLYCLWSCCWFAYHWDFILCKAKRIHLAYPLFIRLTGCPLRCSYCDTTYSFEGGERQSLEHIIETSQLKTPYMCHWWRTTCTAELSCITSTLVWSRFWRFKLETSGALDVSKVDPRVSKVLDLKTPTSNEDHRNLLTNLDYLTQHDQIKFVICNRADYEWFKQQLGKFPVAR